MNMRTLQIIQVTLLMISGTKTFGQEMNLPEQNDR